MEMVCSGMLRRALLLDRVLQEFLGVHQQGTCNARRRLATALRGRRAALLSRLLLAVLQPPGVMPMRRLFTRSILAFPAPVFQVVCPR